MHSIIPAIATFLFPPLCVHCQREGAWLCTTARETLENEHPLINPVIIPGVDRVLVRGSYDCRPLQCSITKLKYSYWSGLRQQLPQLLQPLKPLLPSSALIVPVPLHARRRRERGFNQSDLIAQALSDVTTCPVAHLLHRHRYTTPQAQLKAKQRAINLRDAFSMIEKSSARSTNIILVDDVVTTGSTIAECAAVLRRAGVTTITAVALAKG